MIVKKPYRKVKCTSWDKQNRKFDYITVTDYIGWFLFGVIPIYLIVLDKYVEAENDVAEEPIRLNYGVIEKYAHLMINNK